MPCKAGIHTIENTSQSLQENVGVQANSACEKAPAEQVSHKPAPRNAPRMLRYKDQRIEAQFQEIMIPSNITIVPPNSKQRKRKNASIQQQHDKPPETDLAT
jgi:hypothetical protein